MAQICANGIGRYSGRLSAIALVIIVVTVLLSAPAIMSKCGLAEGKSEHQTSGDKVTHFRPPLAFPRLKLGSADRVSNN